MSFVTGLINYLWPTIQSKGDLEALEPLVCDTPIFEYLHGKDLRTCSLVCGKWHKFLRSDYAMKTLWHRVATDEFSFGPKSYLQFFNKKCVNVLRLPDNIVSMLNENCPIFKGPVWKHWILTYVPDCFEDSALTLNTFEGLVKAPVDGSDGYVIKYHGYLNNVKNQFGDQPLGKSRWVFMSKQLPPDSRNKSLEEQQDFVKRLSEEYNIAYHIPETALEVAVSVLTYHARSGKKLLSNNPRSLARVQQQVDNWPLILGGFDKDSLIVFCHKIVHQNFGVVLVREVL